MSDNTNADERVKGECPLCGRDKWADIRGEIKSQYDDERSGVFGGDTYRLLECRGCNTVYYQHESFFSEDVEQDYDGQLTPVARFKYYPSLSKRDRPKWFGGWFFAAESDLYRLVESLYTAIDNDLLILAASGVRTAFDVAVSKLGIDPTISFEEKIGALKVQGRIGTYEESDLTTMVEAGNAAMHRGWQPTLEQVDTMMTTLERFIHNSFVHEEQTAKLKAKVPPKQRRISKRVKKAGEASSSANLQSVQTQGDDGAPTDDAS
ncbi:DUF4145 domain-containing protein [Hyphomicrobium sp. D-2]|uniref:DUF4145 domain-containing protein n=1 Tax=Hyphomicrobium sp. D-2 TaxID=3041621 RepID=UPI002456D74A|nr:DUF4145 domain-containing protein [Hyphomicrobium sp. D-2]MDH4982189.1 DUF4145 domain-containing protein [Hyphomicrobium sp. D-2]